MSSTMNEAYSEEQSAETSERADAAKEVHASIAWVIGSVMRFGNGIDPVKVLGRFRGGGATEALYRKATAMLEAELAGSRSDAA